MERTKQRKTKNGSGTVHPGCIGLPQVRKPITKLAKVDGGGGMLRVWKLLREQNTEKERHGKKVVRYGGTMFFFRGW